MARDARQRMIDSAALLFREHGYSGTGFRAVIDHSGAPRGSIYHHFPGGKAQLGAETVRAVGERVGEGLDALAEDGDPIALLRALVGAWRATLEETGYRAGCPILAVAAEHHPAAPELAGAAAQAFARWQRPLVDSLRRAGVPAAPARRLAALIVSGLEGAIVLSRATRGPQPLEDAGLALEDAVRAALTGARPSAVS